MRKKAVSGVSFFLIVLTVIVSVGAYFTGLVDGKEADPTLTEAAKEALAHHKLLGTYLLLASGILLFFKLLSMLTAKGIIKGLYLLILIAFVAGIFEQGEHGGELVYKYGMNVEQVKVLDDELFDLKEELEEATATKEVSVEVDKTETINIEAEVPAVQDEPKPAVTESVKMEVEEDPELLKVEGMPEEMVQPEIATH
jgi:uncharacterized membrane protein